MAYCVKCGKELEDGSYICDSCREREIAANGGEDSKKSGRMYCFDKALISVLSVIPAFLMTLFGLIAGTGPTGGLAMLVFWIISLIIAIIALKFGIQSIMAFVRNTRLGLPKPVATLVLGIIGVVGAATCLIMLFTIIGTIITAIIKYA